MSLKFSRTCQESTDWRSTHPTSRKVSDFFFLCKSYLVAFITLIVPTKYGQKFKQPLDNLETHGQRKSVSYLSARNLETNYLPAEACLFNWRISLKKKAAPIRKFALSDIIKNREILLLGLTKIQRENKLNKTRMYMWMC